MAENKSFMKSLRAYEKIRDMILSGVKLPGTRLVLSELETELGIGRGPIREALMRLDRSGLVKNIPYKGAIVATPPTQKEILHIYELRADLEAKLAIEAIDNLSTFYESSEEDDNAEPEWFKKERGYAAHPWPGELFDLRVDVGKGATIVQCRSRHLKIGVFPIGLPGKQDGVLFCADSFQ